MKIITTLILILISLNAIAKNPIKNPVKNPVKKSNTHFRGKSKDNVVYCKEKLIPVKAIGELQSNLLRVFISTDSAIKNFSITGARGVDKVDVVKFSEIKNMSLNPNEEVETSIELSNLEGLAFVVLDISFEKNSKKFINFLTIPVGVLSSEQITERRKDIKTIITKRPKGEKQNPNALSTESETVHAMQLGN